MRCPLLSCFDPNGIPVFSRFHNNHQILFRMRYHCRFKFAYFMHHKVLIECRLSYKWHVKIIFNNDHQTNSELVSCISTKRKHWDSILQTSNLYLNLRQNIFHNFCSYWLNYTCCTCKFIRVPSTCSETDRSSPVFSLPRIKQL